MADHGSRDITLRSILVGALMTAVMVVWFSYGAIFLMGSDMVQHYMGSAALFLLFVLVVVVNPLIKLVNRNLSFSSSELATIHTMMWIAAPLVTWGLALVFIPLIGGIIYYSTPENRYIELIAVNLPSWAIPQNRQAIVDFFEGVPEGQGVAWGAWIEPLTAWFIFLMALYIVMICMVAILRKQWIDRERLIFPIAKAPIEMIRGSDGRELLNPLFKSRLFWFGVAIPLFVGSWRGLHNYFYFLPDIKLVHSIPILRNSINLEFAVLFYLIGLTYFINQRVAFSLWFFSILGNLQTGMFRVIGWSLGPRETCTASGPSVSHQAMGALIVFVVLGLWHARSHLRDVFGKAFGRRNDVDDSDEMLSYRTAVFGLIIGMIVMVVWLHMAGLKWYFSLFFLFGAFVIFIGLTKAVVEGGVAAVKSPLTPQSFTAHGIGETTLGSVGMSALFLTFSWASELKTTPMASAAHGLKLAEESGVRRRKLLFLAMVIGLVIGLVGSCMMVLHLGYKYGGNNLHGEVHGAGNAFASFTCNLILNPSKNNGLRWLFTGVGALVMGFLMVMRHRFLWWPFHPIGFAVGNTLPMIHTWFSVFIAWMIKGAVLKYGGPKVYRGSTPLFLGLIIGQVLCAGIWLVVDHFAGMTGNVVIPFE